MATGQLIKMLECLRRSAALDDLGSLTDGQLLERFLQGRDTAALDALVRRLGPLVLGVCRRVLGPGANAEDAFQATFLVLTRKAASVMPRELVSHWIYGVAYRTALKARTMAFRRGSRERQVNKMPERPAVSADLWDDLQPVLDRELDALPEIYRVPIIYCGIGGKTKKELARQLGVPEGTVSARLARGRHMLRTRLSRHGWTISSAAVTALLSASALRADVPRTLITLTVCAAHGPAGGAPAGTVPAKVHELMEGVLKSMFLAKLRQAALILMLGAVALLIGIFGLSMVFATGSDEPAASQSLQASKEAKNTDAFGDALPPGAAVRLGTVRWRHSAPVRFLALPSATTAISAANDRLVCVWDWSSGAESRQFGPGPRLREATDGFMVFGRPTEIFVAVSADGKVLATKFDDPAVDLWEVASGKKLASIALAKTDLQAIGLALSPNGKRLALCSSTGVVRIWDVQTQKTVREFGQASDMSARFVAVHYTPDGKHLISVRTELEVGAATAHMHVWDPETGQELRSLKLTSTHGPLVAVCSPDSKLLAYAWDDQICVVKTKSGEKVSQWKSHMPAMVFAADSSKLYCKLGHEVVIREYEVSSGKQLRRLPDTSSLPSLYWKDEVVASLALSPDGKRLAVGGDMNSIRVVDLETGKELPAASGHVDVVRHVGFMPDGKSILSAANLGACIWDAGTGKRLKQLSSEQDGHFAVSLDSRYLATVGPRRSIVVRDTAKNETVLTIAPAKNPGSFPVFCFSPDGRILLVRRLDEKVAVLHEVPSGKERCRITLADTSDDRHPEDNFFFSADGDRLAVFSPGNRLAVHDAKSGKRLQEITLDLDAGSRWSLGPAAPVVRSAVFAPDGRTIAIDRGDGMVQWIELASGQPRRTLGKKHTFPALEPPLGGLWSRAVESQVPGSGTVAFSPDSRLLAQAAVDHAVAVWDVATGKLLARFQGHRGAIFSVAFSPDGHRLASGGADTTALIWDVEGLCARAGPTPQVLTVAAAQSRWNDLGAQAQTAADAMNALVASPREAVWLCKARLQPVPPVDPATATKLIDQLDSPMFQVREKAQADLLALGETVAPYLEKALARKNSLETDQRLEKVHSKLTAVVLTGDSLRFTRAIEVLERIGSAESRQLLQTLADGAPGALVTTQARAALDRLK